MGFGRARNGRRERGRCEREWEGGRGNGVLVRSVSRASVSASIRRTSVADVSAGLVVRPSVCPCTRVPRKCLTTVSAATSSRRRARRRWSAAAV